MIDTTDIRVDYGDTTAVTDISVSIGAGEIYGLIGPNGAGKTSLIRVLATLREPTYGDAKIAGHDILLDRAAARRAIGYMPDLAPVYKELRCWEFLDLFARAYGVGRQERRRRIDQAFELVNLGSKRDVLAGTLSRGMTQRLVLAKTLLHDPAVLLLDEPASGLDPIARIDLRSTLKTLGEMGKTVVISSHILNELSEFCTSIGIMERGHMVVHGAIDDIVASLNTTRRFSVDLIGDAASAAAAAAWLREQADISSVELVAGDGQPGSPLAALTMQATGRDAAASAEPGGNGTAVDGASAAASGFRHRCDFECAADDESAADLLAALIAAGHRVCGFAERRRGVEDVMVHVGASEVS